MIDHLAVAAADERIRPYIRHTPVMRTTAADFAIGEFPLNLKLEYMQYSGSFKCRGAFFNLLSRDVPDAGVVAASGGNHGAAVAFAAMTLGIPAKIFVPKISSPAKIARIKQYGADLFVDGERYADALKNSEVWQARSGAMSVHAFDQPETIMGQGTVGVELIQDVPSLDTVLVSVGGGGLISGIAAWFGSKVKVIGVEPKGAPTMTVAFAAGGPADAEAGSIAADSLAPRQIGANAYIIAKKFVDELVLVEDDAIRAAQDILWERTRVVVEPGAATAFAALTSGAYKPIANETVAVVLSGANTTAVGFDN